MENIEQAVERARERQATLPEQHQVGPVQRTVDAVTDGRREPEPQEVALDGAHLQSNRIISHMITDLRTRSFDMLRTQVLQLMDARDWKVIAITSPTPSCGKTVTALNLALSIARQPERSALVVDLDFHKAKVATYLGLQPFGQGAAGVVKGQTPLSKAIVRARIGGQQVTVLPTASTGGSAELIASRAMVAMMQGLRKTYYSKTIILDLPPILTSDDVIALLPQVDCALLVTAVGTSTVAQIDECNRHLQSTEVLRVVLNKVAASKTDYYYYN